MSSLQYPRVRQDEVGEQPGKPGHAIAAEKITPGTGSQSPDGFVSTRLRWPASLDLGLERTRRGTRLIRQQHYGPLYVQKPFYPEGEELAHIYLLHPPGGLVSGDEIDIRIELKEGSQALFTTPGASRIYRARADQAKQLQQVNLNIANGASVEWLPLETILFPGANGSTNIQVELGETGHFTGWEISCLGLPASGRSFNAGELHQRLSVSQCGEPVLIDKLSLASSDLPFLYGKSGLDGHCVLGIFVCGPHNLNHVDSAELDQFMSALREIEAPAGSHLAFSMVGTFLVARYLGDSSGRARELFVRTWEIVRPVSIGRAACRPRIWST